MSVVSLPVFYQKNLNDVFYFCQKFRSVSAVYVDICVLEICDVRSTSQMKKTNKQTKQQKSILYCIFFFYLNTKYWLDSLWYFSLFVNFKIRKYGVDRS